MNRIYNLITEMRARREESSFQTALEQHISEYLGSIFGEDFFLNTYFLFLLVCDFLTFWCGPYSRTCLGPGSCSLPSPPGGTGAGGGKCVMGHIGHGPIKVTQIIDTL